MKATYLLLALLLFILAGCYRGNFDINPEVTNFENLIIADDFDFKSSNEINARITLSDNDPSVVEIYTTDPNEDGVLLKKGISDKTHIFRNTFVLPSYYEEVYVLRRSFGGKIESKYCRISDGDLYNSFGGENKSTQTNSYLVTAGTYPDCSSAYDYDVPNNASGNLQVTSGETWRLDVGNTYDDGKIKFLGTGGYMIICGDAIVSKVQGKGTIVVTSTGSLKVEDEYHPTNGSTLINYGDVEIKDGSSWETINLKNGLIENHGTMEANKIDKLDNTDLLNTGTLTLHDKLKLKNSDITNDGTLIVEHFDFDNTSCIIENFDQITLSEDVDLEADLNNYSGTIHFEKKLEIKSTGSLYNACEVYIEEEIKVEGDIENAGYIHSDDEMDIEWGAAIVLHEGSLISIEDFELGSAIIGPTGNYAKIEVNDNSDLKWGSGLSGKIDYCDDDGTIESNLASIGNDVTYCVNEVPSTNCIPGNGVSMVDQDNDGVPDALDEYPADATRAFNSYYPNAIDFASVAFEDLWPAKGDYDFNDLVVDFQYQLVSDANNEVVDIIGKYQIKAVGATLANGFGVSFDVDPTKVTSVTGTQITGNLISTVSNGLEQGHTNKSVVIIYDNVNNTAGSMANTTPGSPTVTSAITTVTINLNTPQASIGTEPFNPFIFINQIRGREVHLADHEPTALVDTSYFGEDNDATNGSTVFYKTAANYPWAIEVPTSFVYPIEKADIVSAHNKFAPWAESSGASFTNWFENQPGFRNGTNIYQ